MLPALFPYLLQAVLLGLPLIYLAQKGALRIDVSLKHPPATNTDFRPLFVLLFLLCCDLGFGWLTVLAEHGWDYILRTQGGG